jgi:hypothetical protein
MPHQRQDQEVLASVKEKIGNRVLAILLSWRHPGFPVFQGEPVAPEDHEARQRPFRYMAHPPVALYRLYHDRQSRRRSRPCGALLRFPERRPVPRKAHVSSPDREGVRSRSSALPPLFRPAENCQPHRDAPATIKKIPRHLRLWDRPERPPPIAAKFRLLFRGRAGSYYLLISEPTDLGL